MNSTDHKATLNKPKVAERWLPVLEQLEQGLLIVTASNRQADFLRQQYRYYLSEKQNVWYQPAIITDKQWTQTLFQELQIQLTENSTICSLLSEQESRLLWEKIIEEDGDFLLDNQRTAERVRQAANRVEQWLLTDTITTDDSYEWREETRRFKQWQKKAEKRCRQNHWLESYQLDSWLNKNIHLLYESKLSKLLPQKIGLIGFQQLSPARKQLFNSLKKCSIELVELKPETIQSEVYRLELADNHQEILQAAKWAKQQWLANPKQRLGIILPTLQNNREVVRIIFERLFCPAQILKNEDLSLRPFDISLGLPLASYPLIDSAIMLINLLGGPLEQEEVILLLLSPFITRAENQNRTIALTTLLRRSRQPEFSLDDLQHFNIKNNTVEEDEQQSIAFFISKLRTFNNSNLSLPSSWAIQLNQLLEDVQWCEKRSLSSAEYQTKEAWYKTIEKMAIYDQMAGTISWYNFSQLFKRTLHETLFQPQTGDCPIQIMGVLEAAFLTFDKVRICGVDNQLWPAKANPSPFIPYELQKQHQMPNATAERELAISKQLLDLISKSATEVIFSHCKGNGEESLSVSPLIESVEIRPANLDELQNDKLYLSPADLINGTTKEIEFIDDNIASPIQAKQVRGGSKLLQDIAKCQFRAFAHHRLLASQADAPREGLDPLDRGNLVHKVLERCWLEVFNKQQSKLQQLLESEQLDELIVPLIFETLEQLQKQRLVPLTPAIIKLEQQRLLNLILKWLSMEAKRPTFTVLEVEQTVEASLADATIKLQLDRVDELEDGSLAIIDYKTGTVDRNNWFGERPDEPQLPLYAMVLADQQKSIGALLYGQVKTAECKFSGVADDKSLVSGLSKNFEKEKLNTDAQDLAEQVSAWREHLQSLMDEYLSGEAAVTPRDDKVCRYCDLHGLCRITEHSQLSSTLPLALSE